jgi:hypothetical protein
VIGPLLKGTPTVPVLFAPQVTMTPGLIVIEQADPTAPLASLTWMVKVPEAVGVPVTAPVDVFRIRPDGSVPDPIENVYGATPPVTLIAPLLKATPTVPVFVLEQVTESPGTMVYGQVVVATTPFASLTLMEKAPAAVGVPVIAPVEALSVRPPGNVPVATVKVYGATPPVTVGAGLLKGTPTSPELTAEQVIVGPATMVYGQVVAAATPLASLT